MAVGNKNDCYEVYLRYTQHTYFVTFKSDDKIPLNPEPLRSVQVLESCRPAFHTNHAVSVKKRPLHVLQLTVLTLAQWVSGQGSGGLNDPIKIDRNDQVIVTRKPDSLQPNKLTTLKGYFLSCGSGCGCCHSRHCLILLFASQIQSAPLPRGT